MNWRATAISSVFLSAALVASCKDSGKISVEQAKAHVAFLVDTVASDVEEVHRGLPQGAAFLAAAWKVEPQLDGDLKAVRVALDDSRHRVQDLRIAKSTFFALADLNGVVLRNDQEQDRMAGKALFPAFPALVDAKTRYVEATGSLPEASGVRAPRQDGQWVAATPVVLDGVTKGIYVTGWSWSSYAYRLEFALRSKIRSDLGSDRDQKEPLLYVFVLVGKSVYGAPVSPDVNMTTIAALEPLSKTKENEPFAVVIDITGRTFGLAVRRTPSFGNDVGVAVLRSET
jgi:hypothetical protein